MKPFFTPRTLLASALALTPLLAAQPAAAFDARSIALGGSIVADGRGVAGALANPSSMMRMNRKGQRIHLHLGAGAEMRDPDGFIQDAQDADDDDLVNRVDDELEALDGATITCVPFLDDQDSVCLSGTRGLGQIAGDLLDVANDVDEDDISAQGSGHLGFAFTGGSTPIAVHLIARGTVAGGPDITDNDRDYIGTFNNLLIDDELTLGEIENSEELIIDTDNQSLTVRQPEDILDSTADASYLIRTQLGISFARSIGIAGVNVDFGVTPKFSVLTATSNRFQINEEFADNQPSAEDRFNENEVEESTFTFDAGASASLFAVPLRLGAVIRNVVPESVTTEEDVEFETTPQLIVGGVFDLPMISFNADLALNEAKVDNFETQVLAIGAEFTPLPLLALRAGISSDLANSQTALSLGAGAGPVQIGARATELEELQLGLNVSFSF